jgi:alkanesulfonate monooxygenase SsuD/methylene tetrahydromethanopterin reductase-like flavin-dependent oxidoreductase (luciferase family)
MAAAADRGAVGIRAGIIITAGGPREAAELAAEAEAAGWDGVFTWDGIALGPMYTYDPWIVMAAMAMRTSRVRLGAIITPPSRRRPWKLARETMTLDRLSDGRLVLPVGLGALDDAGFGNVGEATEARVRAERLDESLAILDGLWSGEPFAFSGTHFRFEAMTFLPTPVQLPRIPIWVVGAWPSERSMARAARWDGLIAQAATVEGAFADWSPARLAEAVAWIHEHRPTGASTPYDVIAQGDTPADDPRAAWSIVEPWAAAGATWWIEADWEHGTVDAIRRRIAAGPPRP